MVMVRTTQNLLADRSTTYLQQSLSRLARTQETLSTGKVVNRVSDSPTDAIAAMRLRTGLADQTRYVRNAQDGLSRLGVLDTTLGSMGDDVRRVRELALQGVNASSNPTSREAAAIEIDQLRDNLLSLANTTHLGAPVLGGVTGGKVAFAPDGTYVGETSGESRRTVADGVTVRVDVVGSGVVGPDGANLFDDLAALSAALRSGDEDAMRVGIDALAARGTALSTARADAGAAYNRAEGAASRGEDALIALRTSLSEVEDTDLARAMVDLKIQEVGYQAALAATARVLQPSLIDFLR